MRRFGSTSTLGDDPVVSPRGLCDLRSNDGVATLSVVASGQVVWLAGDKDPVIGQLRFADDGGLEVVHDRHRVWRTSWSCRQAMYLVVTDGNDLELLDENLVPLRSLIDGVLDVRPLLAPTRAAAVTRLRFLLRQDGAVRRTVTRLADGSLLATERRPAGGWTARIEPEDALGLEKPGHLLAWVIGKQEHRLSVVPGLVDPAGRVVWTLLAGWANDETAGPMTGGDVLAHGCRLRHQSLTSKSGRHTLVHQPDGNLVLYDNVVQEARWATGTDGEPGSWVEIGAPAGLSVRNGRETLFATHTDNTPLFLQVQDDGDVALVNEDATVLWRSDTADAVEVDAETQPLRPGRGARLLPGEHLQRQSLTSQDGSTVLTHTDDGRLILFGTKRLPQWTADARAAGGHLTLTDDGMLVLRSGQGADAARLAGPGAELVVLRGQLQLRTKQGAVLWRDGDPTLSGSNQAPVGDPADLTWSDPFRFGPYRLTVIKNRPPLDVLLQLGIPHDELTFNDGEDDAIGVFPTETDEAFESVVLSAFAVGNSTLLVEVGGPTIEPSGIELSQDGFVVTCGEVGTEDSDFLVYRNGQVIADLSWSRADDRWREVPSLAEALTVMKSTDPETTAADHPIELLCRTAHIAPNAEMSADPAFSTRRR